MLSFKGIRKYLIYACLAGWMFFLGVVVGRGLSPVNFDTREFSRKLETLVNGSGQKKEIGKKVDLKFYENLDKPAAQDSVQAKHTSLSSSAEKEPIKEAVKETVKESEKETAKIQAKPQVKDAPKEAAKEAIKESQKEQARETHKEPIKELPKEPVKEPVKESVKTVKKELVKKTAPAPAAAPPAPAPATVADKPLSKESKGAYTIQVASYKSYEEAVSRISALEGKGFASYQVKVEKEGSALYRVKMGPFETYDAAKEFKTKLDKAKIDAIIVKGGE